MIEPVPLTIDQKAVVGLKSNRLKKAEWNNKKTLW